MNNASINSPQLRLLFLGLLFAPIVQTTGFTQQANSKVTGELKQWHKVTLTVDGPEASEDGNPNPFLDFRMNVEFRHADTGKVYLVPGYFAADGNAANTSATAGNKWRAHLAPDNVGKWFYKVSFRSGERVAVSDDSKSGTAVEGADGIRGEFFIVKSDKSGRDFRAKGRLDYVGKHHLQFAGTGEYFLKAGVDAPENFLAYRDFDGDFKKDGHKDNLIKDWKPHIRDWKSGDPTWKDGKGKGIIGAINYLASQGLNVFSFLTLNIDGDDRNVFPYVDYDERERIDCSRMDQWGIVFEHGTRMGMYLHFKTQEAENVNLLDNGHLGSQRKLYYRELIARFGHNLALNWNLGEEVGLGHEVSTKKKKDWANYLKSHDPYQHHIVIHNGNNHYDLLGKDSALTGFSLQTNQADFRNVHRATLNYLRRSDEAGKPWVVACDEPGDAQHSLITDAEDPSRKDARRSALWGNIMAGGAGVEWYFGYKHPHSDLTCQDYRVREKMWKQSRVALAFFEDNNIPFWKMANANGKLTHKNGYCLSDPGKLYLVFLKTIQPTFLDLTGVDGPFEVLWFNPRVGGKLKVGSVPLVKGGKKVLLGNPSNDNDPEQDWLVVVRPGDATRDYPPMVSVPGAIRVMLPKNEKAIKVQLRGAVEDDRQSAKELKVGWAKETGPGRVDFQNATSAATDVIIQGAGKYVLSLTANDGSQQTKARTIVHVLPFQSRVTRTLDSKSTVYLEGDKSFSNQHLKVEGKRRTSFIKFDLTKLPPRLVEAKLVLTGGIDGGNGTLRVFQGAGSDWKTETLNRKNAPKQGKMLGQSRVEVGNGDAISIGLNGIPKDGGVLTLIVTLDQGGNDIWFGSHQTRFGPKLLLTFDDPDEAVSSFGKPRKSGVIKKAAKAETPRQESKEQSFEFTYDASKAKKVHVQSKGIVVVEAEDFDAVDRQSHRKWLLTTKEKAPGVKPDPDPNHAAGAVGGAYLEILPDTRVTHSDPLVHGVSFSNVPGQCSVLYYPVVIQEPGRYYVWVRMCCTGSEDNGLHVGLDGKWPASGARLQFTGKHGQWQWDSRQRTEKVHTGVLGKIWLDIDKPGLHTIMFSMREDGFEFDRFLLTKKPKFMASKNMEPGPAASPRKQ